MAMPCAAPLLTSTPLPSKKKRLLQPHGTTPDILSSIGYQVRLLDLLSHIISRILLTAIEIYCVAAAASIFYESARAHTCNRR